MARTCGDCGLVYPGEPGKSNICPRCGPVIGSASVTRPGPLPQSAPSDRPARQPPVQYKSQLTNYVLIAGVVVVSIWWKFLPAGKAPAPEEPLSYKVARDAAVEFDIARRNGGTAMDLCVQASFVNAAWLQAKNEAEYAKWKTAEKEWCALAGLPR